MPWRASLPQPLFIPYAQEKGLPVTAALVCSVNLTFFYPDSTGFSCKPTQFDPGGRQAEDSQQNRAGDGDYTNIIQYGAIARAAGS